MTQSTDWALTALPSQSRPAEAATPGGRFIGRCADCWAPFTVEETLVFVPARMAFVHRKACK